MRSILLSTVGTLLLASPWAYSPVFAARIVAWGYNADGQCNVPDGNDFVAIAAGYGHSLALKADGSIVAWGSNQDGQCNVPAGSDFVAIAAGDDHSLAIRSNGSLVAWGDNRWGQCDTPSGNDFVAVAGGAAHSLALRSDGSAVGWGCGFGDRAQCNVPQSKDFVAVAAYGSHSLAVTSDGSLIAWGDHRYGRCDVPEGSDFVAVATGAMHNVALRADGSLAAAGSNPYGQLDVPKGNDFVAIAAGIKYSLALRADGSIVAWGGYLTDWGHLDVPEGNNFVAIAAGTVHNLALVEGPPVPEAFVYVDAVNGDDTNNGQTPETAYATIQKGIDAAPSVKPSRAQPTVEPVRIMVYPGVYTEAINFKGKAIMLTSARDAAILEAPGDYAVSFYSGEGRTSILKNFVIRNSYLGIFIVDSSPTISNVTVVNNGFGIAAYADADPDISSSIFWNNADGDLSGCQAQYSCIEHVSQGEGNISIDPLFADPAKGDYHLLAEKGRYVSAYGLWSFDDVTSPCVDAGDPAVDPSSERMPNGGRINMGAYGGTPYASLSEWPIASDLNRDGVVDLADLRILCQQWLTELPSDGVVPEDDPPVPNPAQWDQDGEPREVYGAGGASDYWAEMRAVEAADASGWVEYFFECTAEPAFSSGWQRSPEYLVREPRQGMARRFRVKARDLYGNETAWSEELPALTAR